MTSFLAVSRRRPLPLIFSRCLAAAVTIFLCAQSAWAQEGVILTVVERATGTETRFDRAAIAALPEHTLDTHTSVTDGVHHFEGPLMRDLLGAAGFTGDAVLAIALNDYEITIPMSDFEEFDVIAALTMDGEVLTPRDRGPIWIVYPRDDHPELQDIRYDYRWVWQLTRIQSP